jgi:tetratricopeptide (TPR) repeat protein/predicted Ser/Thr protein kinase
MIGCLDDNAIAALLDGEVLPAERAALSAHLDTCDACRALVADAFQSATVEGPRILGPGTTLDRYVVLEAVGAGAMGVVYAAYDPELGRKVALKVLRPDPLADSPSRGARRRLLREAQALAKLSHPHVIAIHDVGTLDGEIFLTMEFIEGGTLGGWLASGKRSWRAVLELLRQAGEGLAAAHEKGLIHRDFKPENVLVEAGRRARVTDFGLARPAGERGPNADDRDADEAAARNSEAPPEPHLTATGVLVGTPAYMAPEQLAGGPADALSDQFSYCVTLYEALHGERPFEGTDVASLQRSIARGQVRPAPPSRRIPAWLRRLVTRGLQADPARRFPSMRALLDALGAGPAAWPKRIAIAATLAVGVALVASSLSRRAPSMCTGADAAWSGAWDASHATVVRAAFERAGRPSGAHALAEVTRALDDESARWHAMHRDTCEATRVRGEQSELLLDLRMRCLDDRRREVATLTRLLENADGEIVDHAVSASLSLPALDACTNLRALSAQIPLPSAPAVRTQIDAVDERLAQATALEHAGKFASGLELVGPIAADARRIGFAPLTARVLLEEGHLASAAGDFARAERVLHEAGAFAEDAHDDLLTADAWSLQVWVIGFQRGRPQDGRSWARYAEAAIDRAGGDDVREARRLRDLSIVAWKREGQLDEARDLVTRARALNDRSRGPSHEQDVANCNEDLAGIYFDMARPADALGLHRQVTAARQRVVGADHPSMAIAYVNEGEDLAMLGRADEAIPILERALAIMAPLHERGGDGYYHHRLAAALRVKGDARGALEHDRAALAASSLALDSGAQWDAWPLTGIGLDLLALDRPAEAAPPLERAVKEQAAGAAPFEIAESRFALARALWETGARDRARTLAESARDGIRTPAERYGSWYAARLDAIDRWLGAHPAGRK